MSSIKGNSVELAFHSQVDKGKLFLGAMDKTLLESGRAGGRKIQVLNKTASIKLASTLDKILNYFGFKSNAFRVSFDGGQTRHWVEKKSFTDYQFQLISKINPSAETRIQALSEKTKNLALKTSLEFAKNMYPTLSSDEENIPISIGNVMKDLVLESENKTLKSAQANHSINSQVEIINSLYSKLLGPQAEATIRTRELFIALRKASPKELDFFPPSRSSSPTSSRSLNGSNSSTEDTTSRLSFVSKVKATANLARQAIDGLVEEGYNLVHGSGNETKANPPQMGWVARLLSAWYS